MVEIETFHTESGAVFSDCRTYRYALWRRWDGGGECDGIVNFIGLNPSTADETADDPTIRRCIGFAKSWGASGIVMTNLFAFRATDPKVMKEATAPVGRENDHYLRWIAGWSAKSIACWGAHGRFNFRGSHVRCLIGSRGLWCFGKTKGGQPKHPLYLPKTAELIRFDE